MNPIRIKLFLKRLIGKKEPKQRMNLGKNTNRTLINWKKTDKKK